MIIKGKTKKEVNVLQEYARFKCISRQCFFECEHKIYEMTCRCGLFNKLLEWDKNLIDGDGFSRLDECIDEFGLKIKFRYKIYNFLKYLLWVLGVQK